MVISLICLLAATGPAWAAELVMFRKDGCAWCEQFDKDIAPIYPHTPEARCAPLRHVDIHGAWPDDLAAIKGIVFTPTFVLVEDGREVARRIGYPGEDFFWGLLAQDLKLLKHPCILP